MIHELLSAAGENIVYIGGFSDFKGVAKPLTLVISGARYTGATTAAMLCFGVGVVIDLTAVGEDSLRDRIAGVLYYGATVASIAFFGWSKEIQSAVIGMNITGQLIDGALIASAIAFFAHLYLIAVIFAGAGWLNGVRTHATKMLGIGHKRKGRLNTKIMFSFPVVALTVPLAAGPLGYLIGFVAKLTTVGSLTLASAVMSALGAY